MESQRHHIRADSAVLPMLNDLAHEAVSLLRNRVSDTEIPYKLRGVAHLLMHSRGLAKYGEVQTFIRLRALVDWLQRGKYTRLSVQQAHVMLDTERVFGEGR